ncbi:MAG: SAM-dependent methyltransferase [Planctomycetota bacterium]|nr:SAM-dependent methyltransferase [Planctomycetota bacterium]
MAAPSEQSRFVSRGGDKLAHALTAFAVDVRAARCADLGCSTGGFTDCLLTAGAAHVIAVDTAYGVLAYSLRADPRVTVIERSNALHLEPTERVDLVTLDLSWTPQRLAIPAALPWLKKGGRIITLIKPHYEASDQKRDDLLDSGVLPEADAERIAEEVFTAMPSFGAAPLALTRSPVAGGARKRGRGRGNIEFLALVEPRTVPE